MNFSARANLTFVKTFRLWLLLLLAVLLPVRGALAVAMQCSPDSQVQAQAPHAHHSDEQHASRDGQAHHQLEGAVHDHSDAAGHDHAGATDKCNLCAASCSATALVSASMTLVAPQSVSAVFSHIHAPPPSFIPDGQERPPRTI